MTKTPPNVLFIPSGSIGDALMMLALCVEIEKFRPDTKFTIIARRNAKLIADLAAAYPFIHVIKIEKNIRGLCTLIWNAFCRPYAALMPAAFGKSWFLNTEQLFKLLAVRPGTETYGLLKKEGDANPYTRGLVYGPNLIHFENMRRLAVAAGFTTEAIGAPIAFSLHSRLPKDFPYAPKSYIVLHPFGSSSWKSWSPRRSREFLVKLGELYPQYSFVVTGGAENAEQAKAIIKDVPRAISATGLPILEAAGIIENAALFIGVDTGTMHLASVMQQKVVALEHNASPEWLPIYNPNAIILTTHEHCVCGGVKNDACKAIEDGVPYLRCLYEISDQSIFSAVASCLKV